VLKGYGTDGTWIEETKALSGTDHVQSTATFLHLYSAVLASNATGIVTVAEYNSGDPSSMFTVPVGEKGGQDMFLKVAAEASGGSTKKFYESCFIKNTDGASAVINAVIWLNEDEDSELKMDLGMSGDVTVTGGSETTTNRVTEPSTGGTYAWAEHASQEAAHDVGDAEDGNLTAGEYQQVWVELTLADGRTPEQVVQWAPKVYGEAT